MKKRIFGRELILAFALALVCLAWWAQPVSAAPEGGTVTSGNAAIDQSMPGVTNITQFTDRVILNWEKYGIGLQELVRYLQPNDLAVALNRVTGVDPSVVLGSLQANGRIFIINPNGILFGPQSKVDVGGLLATTLTLSDQDFLNGNYAFVQDPAKQLSFVVNKGQIKAADGGYVVLVAPLVNNEGTIIANLGHVVLAGGSQATVSFDAQHLVNFTLPANNGATGNVVMTTEACADVLRQAVNNQGIVEAGEVLDQDGKVILVHAEGLAVNSGTIQSNGAPGQDAGTVLVHSTQATVLTPTSNLEARGIGENSNGGFIETSTYRNIVIDGEIRANAEHGRGGTWLIDPNDIEIVAGGGNVNINNTTPFQSTNDTAQLGVTLITSALNVGTSVTVQAMSAGSNTQSGDIVVSSAITTTGAGSLTLTAAAGSGNVAINAPITLAGGNFTSSGVDFTSNSSGAITTGGGNVVIGNTGAVIIGAAINTNGANGVDGYPGHATGGTGGAGGAVSITNASAVTLTGGITTNGGTGGAGDTGLTPGSGGGGGTGGAGGAVGITNASAVTLNGVITTSGGAGGAGGGDTGGGWPGGGGGTGGAVNITTTAAGDVTINGAGNITTSGGWGGSGGYGGPGGADGGGGGTAGAISISAAGDVTINGAGNITSIGGGGGGCGGPGGDGGGGGNGSAISISAAGNVAINEGITTSGGPGGAGDTAGSSGIGGACNSTGVDFDNTGDAITTGGGLVTLNHSGAVTIAANILAGTGNIYITNAASVFQTAGAVQANALSVNSVGSVDLGNTGNNVAALAGQVTCEGSTFSYVDMDALTVGTVGGANGIITNNGEISVTVQGNGNLTVSQPVNAGSNTVSMMVDGAGNLLTINAAVTGTGGVTYTADDMALTGVTDATGAVAVLHTEHRSIDLGNNTAFYLGLTNTELDTITAGTLEIYTSYYMGISITASISPAHVSTLYLVAPSGFCTITQTPGSTVTVANLAIQVADGVIMNEANHVTNLAATVANSGQAFSFTNADALTVGGPIDGLSGIITIDGDITLTTGNTLTLSQNLNAGTGTVSLTASGSGSITQTGGSIFASSLAVEAANAVDLNKPTNDVAILAGRVTTDGQTFSYTDANAVTIDYVGALNGVTSTNGAIAVTTVNGDLIVNNTPYADVDAGTSTVTLTAGGSGSLLTVTGNVSGTGGVTYIADDMALTGATMADESVVNLRQATNGRLIYLGADAAGKLSLTDAELGTITAGSILIGNADSGDITISGVLSSIRAATLFLITGGSIAQDAGATISVANLAIQSIGSVNLDENNSVNTLAANISGAGNSFSYTNAGALTVGGSSNGIVTNNGVIAVATVSGDLTVHNTPYTDISAGTSTVTLTAGGAGSRLTVTGDVRGTGGVTYNADDMTLTGATYATGAVAVLRPTTAGRNIDLGTNTAETLGITQAELNMISSTLIEVGRNDLGGTGSIAVSKPISRNTLSLSTGGMGTITQTGALTVTNLAVCSGGAVTLTLNNHVTNLAANVTGADSAFSYTNADALTVGGPIDGLSGIITTNGDITLTAGGALTVGAPINTNGGVFTSFGTDFDNTGGAITTGGGSVTINNTGAITVGSAINASGAPGGAITVGSPSSLTLLNNLTTNNAAINLNTATSVTGNSTLAAGNGDITLGATTISNGVLLTLTTTSAPGLVNLASVAGPGNLTINNAGLAHATLAVGSGTAIGTLMLQGGAANFDSTVAAANVTLNNTSGTVAFGGAVTFSTLGTASNAFNIAFNGGGTVTTVVSFLNTGTVTLGNDAGDVLTFTGGLNTTAGPTATNIAGAVRTAGQQMDFGAVTLMDNSTIDTSNNGGSAAGATINVGVVTGATFGLTLNGGTTGAVTVASAANVGALTLNNTGAYVFAGDVTAASLATAGAGAISFNGAATTITASTTFANTGVLNLGNGGGDVLTFAGGLDTTGVGGLVTVNGTIQTNGTQMDLGAVILGGTSTLATNNTVPAGANMNIGATSGAQALILNAGSSGDIGFTGIIGTPTSLTIENARNVGLPGTTITGALNQTTGSGTTTFGDVTNVGSLNMTNSNFIINGPITANAGDIRFIGALLVAQDIVAQGPGKTITFSGPGSTFVLGGNRSITTNNGNITLDGAGNANGNNLTLSAGTGTVQTVAISNLNNNFTVTADGIDFVGGANSIIGAGNVVLQPSTDSTSIWIGDGAGSGTLHLTVADIAALQDGFNSITIGRGSGNGPIEVREITFWDPVTIQSPVAPGSITVNGQITGEDNASINLNTTIIPDHTVYLNADIVTHGNSITINDSVLLGNPATVTLNTANGVSAGADIYITGAVDDAGTGSALVLNGGMGGVITLGGMVGGVTPITSITTDAGGSTAINGGGIRTSGDQTYNDAVTLGADTTLTGVGLTFASTIGGAGFDLTLDGGAGAVTLAGAVNVASLDATGGIVNLSAMTLSGALTQNATGATTLNGLITTGGNVNMTAVGIIFAGAGSINAGANTVTLNAGAGSIAGGTATTDITAATANLTAATNIGASNNALATNVGTLNATATAGSIWIEENDAILLNSLTAGQDITLTTYNSGTITVNTISAPLGTVTLTVSGDVKPPGGGEILMGTGTGITAQNLFLSAISDIGASVAYLQTDVDILNATSIIGSIWINDADALTLNNLTAGQNITVRNTVGNMTVGTVTAGTTGTATLTSTAGSILDGNAGLNNITAGTATLTAATNIGTLAEPFGTAVENLNAHSGVSMYITEADAVTLGTVEAGVDAGISNLSGDMTVGTVSAENAVSFSSAGSILGGSISTGTASLTAATNIGTLAEPFGMAVENLNAHSGVSMYITEADAVTLGTIEAGVDAGISNLSGDMTVGTVSAGNAVSFSSAGSILGGSISTGTASVMAAMNIGASGTGGALATNVGTLNATATAGSIWIEENGAVTLNSLTAGQDITLTTYNSGTITVNTISAPLGTVTLTVTGTKGSIGGSIIANAVAGVNVAARNLILTVPNNIGSPLNPLLTKIEKLTALAGSGSLFISEYEAINLVNVRAGLDLSITCAAGNMVLTSVTAGRDAYLTALGGSITGEISKIAAQNIILTMSVGGMVEPIAPGPIITSVETAPSSSLNIESYLQAVSNISNLEAYLRAVSNINNPWLANIPDFSTWILLSVTEEKQVKPANELISLTEKVLYVTPCTNDVSNREGEE